MSPFGNTSSSSTNRRCRRPGTTSCPTCRARHPRLSTRAPWSRPAPTTSPRCSPWTSSSRRSARTGYIDIPGAVLDVYRQWRPTSAVPGPPPRAGPRIRRPASTTSTRASPRPVATSPTRRCPRPTTTPRLGSGADDRDRGRPVGTGPGLRLRALRPGMRDLAGGRELRPEALPAPDDGGVRRRRSTVRRATSPRRAAPSWRPTRNSPGLARHRHLRGRRGGRPGPRDPLRAGQRAQPRADAPDHHRRGGPPAAGQGRRAAPDLLVGCTGGGSNFGGPVLPVPAREVGRERCTRRSGRSSRPRARR